MAPEFARPEEVVSYLGAVQAQEYRLMRWAVGMRTRRPSASAFQEAYDSGRIIRLHLLRGTWQLVTCEDYPWMLSLCADKARRVIEGWMSANHISISDEEYGRIREILVRCAGDKGSVTKEDFAQALAERDIVMDDHRLSYHIRMGELAGVLCSGLLHLMKPTYALVSERIRIGGSQPAADGRLERDEALALLARKYFRSHSPATLEDFIWWTGLNINDCKRGIAALGPELEMVRLNGTDFYLHENARTRGFRKGNMILLPPYDEYLIGYKSRAISLPDAHRHRAHNNSGNFYPIILSDGIVCGNWKPFTDQLSVELFEEADSLSASKPQPGQAPSFPALTGNLTPSPALQQAWDNYRLFLKR